MDCRFCYTTENLSRIVFKCAGEGCNSEYYLCDSCLNYRRSKNLSYNYCFQCGNKTQNAQQIAFARSRSGDSGSSSILKRKREEESFDNSQPVYFPPASESDSLMDTDETDWSLESVFPTIFANSNYDLSIDRTASSSTGNAMRQMPVVRNGITTTGSVNTVRPPQFDIGIITWNINHFKSKADKRTVKQAAEQLKKNLEQKLEKRLKKFSGIEKKYQAQKKKHDSKFPPQESLPEKTQKKSKGKKKMTDEEEPKFTQAYLNAESRYKSLKAEIAKLEEDIEERTNEIDYIENLEEIPDGKEEIAQMNKEKQEEEKTRVQRNLTRKKDWLGNLLGKKYESWLDVLVLQEINASNVEHLADVLKDFSGFEIALGTRMTSISAYDKDENDKQKKKGHSKDEEEENDDVDENDEDGKDGDDDDDDDDEEEDDDDDDDDDENSDSNDDNEEEANARSGKIDLTTGEPLDKKRLKSSAPEIGTGSLAKRVTKRQQEYYPILFDSKRFEFVSSGFFRADTFFPSNYAPDNRNTSANNTVRNINSEDTPAERLCYWSKDEEIQRSGVSGWRPAIIHKLKSKPRGVEVNIAVIHTSPKGKKLSRKGEYDQISGLLEFVRKDQLEKDSFWILAGDYYLDPESTTESENPNAERTTGAMFKTKVANLGLDLITTIGATNQSKIAIRNSKPRDLWLAARQTRKDKIKAQPGAFIGGLKRGRNKEEKAIRDLEDAKNRAGRNFSTNEDFQEVLSHYIGLAPEYKKRQIDSTVRIIDEVRRHVVDKRADFFIATPNFVQSEVGIINPVGGLNRVDIEITAPDNNSEATLIQNKVLDWWMKISDHAPVGAVFVASRPSLKLVALSESPDSLSAEQLTEMNNQLLKIRRFALREVAQAAPEIYAVLGKMYMQLEAGAQSNSKLEESVLKTLEYLENEFLMTLKYYQCLSVVLEKGIMELTGQNETIPRAPELTDLWKKIDSYRQLRYEYHLSTILEEGLYRWLLQKMKEENSQHPREQLRETSLLTILQRTFNSLAALGYLCFDPERMQYSIGDFGLSKESSGDIPYKY